MRNSDPRVRTVLCSQIQFRFPLYVYLASNRLWLPIRVQFWYSLETNLLGQLICRLVVTYTHDMSLALQIVRTRQYVLSWNIVRLQLFSGILHQYKSWSIDLVVEAFPLVLCASALEFLVQEFQSRGVSVSLSINLLAREKWIRLLCRNKSPCSCSTATVLFTQFWDCSVDTELIDRKDCAKNSFNRILIVTEVYRIIFHLLCFWAFLEKTCGSEDWVSAFLRIWSIMNWATSIPFSSWSFFVSEIPLCLWPRSEEWPTSCWKSFCE